MRGTYGNVYNGTHGNEKIRINIECLETEEKFKHIVFYNPDLLSKFKDDKIFVDGTHKSYPKFKNKNVQLLTIMGKQWNTVRY